MATHQILLRGAAQCCLLQAAMHLVDAVSSSLAALRLSGCQAGSRGQGSEVREAAGDAVAARGSASGLGAARCAGGVCAPPPTPQAPGTLGGGPGTGSAHAAAFTR